MKLFNRKKLHIHTWRTDDDFHKRAFYEIVINKSLHADIAQFCICGQSRVVTVGFVLQYIRR